MCGRSSAQDHSGQRDQALGGIPRTICTSCGESHQCRAREHRAHGRGSVELVISKGSEDITFKGTVKAQVAGAIKRLHQNLGHPPNRELVKHLRLGGAGEEMIAAADAFRCHTCQRCADPKPHRISKPAALLDFNDAVALDIIFLDTTESTGNLALNMVDMA